MNIAERIRDGVRRKRQDPEGWEAERRESRDRFLRTWEEGLIDKRDRTARTLHRVFNRS